LLDVVLTNGTNISIFEHHALERLQTELASRLPDIQAEASAPSGFKISESHIRIGSKIHISNFYFAKRFFQSSYYARRFAHLITKTILDVHIPKIANQSTANQDVDSQVGITLFGYGLYSEMMVSTVRDLLASFNLGYPINHDLISDEEALERIRPFEPVYRYTILIVPIASTFSTSLKIENYLMNTIAWQTVLEPHLNVINVYDDSKKEDPETISDIEKKFSWEKISSDHRSVYLRGETSNLQLKNQRYFLRLPTKWHDVKSCELCFSDPPTNEVPLFVTDKTSVTPILILDMPRGRSLKSRNPYKLTHEMLKYGHFSGHFNHNLYYINRELFFKENKASIIQWLSGVRKQDDQFSNHGLPITIISPGHQSNVGFAKLVNEILFDNIGNIIHYDPSGDHAQNFNTFFGTDIRSLSNGSRLFFVDDMLVSGMAFSNCVNFLKYTRDDYKGFDGCIILIDRSNDFVQKSILLELGLEKERFISYADLLLTSIYHADDICPICTEKERYDQLVSISWLDKTQLHFLKQSDKLELKSPNQDVVVDSPPTTYVRRVEATHRIYDWFYLLETGKVSGFDSYLTFKEWVDSVIAYTPTIFVQTTLVDDDTETISETFIKVVTQSPMTHYKPLKAKVFSWLLMELDEHVNQVRQQIGRNELTYAAFRRLKFLIRRAGLLQSNYLISHRLLDVLNELYGESGLPNLIGKESAMPVQDKLGSEKRLRSLNSFFVFYTAQIKELLFRNEARSIKLETNLSKYITSTGINPGFYQILRILREENGILVTSFVEFLTQTSFWKDDLTELEVNRRVRDLLSRPTLQEHFRYKDLEDFLAINSDGRKVSEGLASNRDFLNFLYLYNFLSRERYKEQNLDRKTDVIMTKLRRMVFDDGIECGAFLSVIYKRSGIDNLFFAYNKGERGSVKEFQSHDTNNYFCNFLYGIKDSTGESDITVTEFHKTARGEWIDLYSEKRGETNSVLFGNHLVPSDYNRILLLRINKRLRRTEVSAEMPRNSQGIICFYGRLTDMTPTHISKIRFLLLLRPQISAFIESHHENNEFKDWMDAMVRRRTSLLTGHGREMLMNLVKVNSSSPAISYQSILLTILLTQKTLLDEMDLRRFSTARDFVGLRNFLNLSTDLVDQFYFEDTLKCMAEEIFDLNIIENQEDVKVVVNFDAPAFNFSKQILECICFELFINAKKNRYVFLPKQEIAAMAPSTAVFDKNYVWMDVVDLNGEEVQLTISNTGPNLPEQMKINLKNNYNIKDTGEIGGLEMISTILERLSIGKISLDYTVLNEDEYLSKFLVIIKLKVKHEY
jgi:hypothetical protein